MEESASPANSRRPIRYMPCTPSARRVCPLAVLPVRRRRHITRNWNREDVGECRKRPHLQDALLLLKWRETRSCRVVSQQLPPYATSMAHPLAYFNGLLLPQAELAI